MTAPKDPTSTKRHKIADDALRAAGGLVITLRLSPDAARALARLARHDGCSKNEAACRALVLTDEIVKGVK